jgi:hypothetical protein
MREETATAVKMEAIRTMMESQKPLALRSALGTSIAHGVSSGA